MRHISETFQKPPRIGERFKDGESVVEFRAHDTEVDFSPCERCLYDDDVKGCLRNTCTSRRPDGSFPPDPGYYVKINSGLAK